MEDELDAIAAGTDAAHGTGSTASTSAATTGSEGSVARAGGLKKLVGVNLEDIDAREVNSIPLFDDRGPSIVVRVGRNGPYLERVAGDGRMRSAAREPARRPAAGRADAPSSPRSCSPLRRRGARWASTRLTGHEIVAKDGRYGPYVTEVLPERPPTPAPEEEGRSRGPGRCSRT